MPDAAEPRVIVDPQVREAERKFRRMLERLKSRSKQEHIAEAIRLGLRNADGSPRLPDSEPYLAAG